MKFLKIVWSFRRAKEKGVLPGLLVLVSGVAIAIIILAVNFLATDSLNHARFAIAQSTATTTVTILNTPPNWSVDAQEAFQSSTSTPTNVGSVMSWVGTASDPNSDNYYLLICKTAASPTPGAGGAAPTCGGGLSNQWAVSASAASNAQATANHTVSSTDPQINPWFAWICDNNAGGSQCNATDKQGTGNTASPWVANHNPNFTTLINSSPVNPGAIVTWTASASDTDDFSGATDTLALYVCKANDFSGGSCGAGGTYCSSTAVLANPSCSSTLPIPDQDQNYASYGYVVDNWGLAGAGPGEATNSLYAVNNVAPTLTSSSISLLNTNGSSTPLTLTVPGGTTNGFEVKFTASDNNSCLAAGGGREISSAIADVYRSAITQANCETAGNYDPNNCYPAAIGTSTWNISCSQDAGSCVGSSSLSATWTCTFPLWYVTDPTDNGAKFSSEDWLASVQVTDNNGATSSLTEGATGNTVASFLATQLETNAIDFGALSPGSSTPTLSTSTVLAATGNVGVDEKLFGANLCPNYPSCANSNTSTIAVGNIQYATSSVAYGSGIALTTSSPATAFPIHIPKSTATSSQNTGSTFWGILVPGTILLSGSYTGQNTFVGVESSSTFW